MTLPNTFQSENHIDKKPKYFLFCVAWERGEVFLGGGYPQELVVSPDTLVGVSAGPPWLDTAFEPGSYMGVKR